MTDVVWWDGDQGGLGASVVAMGVFDGVHVGHQALLADTVRLAHDHGARAVALTFDRDPDQIVTPDNAAMQLLSLDLKLLYMGELGLDGILVVPFCSRMARMEPERFLDDVLTDALQPCAVVVGNDFRFGSYASGDVRTLVRYGERAGFSVIAHELIQVEGATVTSTRIRGLVAAGDVEGAARLLGRYHRLEGRVTHGRGEGSPLLGVPTANIRPHTVYAALPADGVYAGYALVGKERIPAAISVGVPPSFPKSLDRLEAHLIDWTGDLYSDEVVVEFVERVRPQEAFSDPAELATRIHNDIEHVREILSEKKGHKNE